MTLSCGVGHPFLSLANHEFDKDAGIESRDADLKGQVAGMSSAESEFCRSGRNLA
jgi:hypothetical protein